MAINGRISVGDIQAFIQYMRSFTQPLNQIAQIMNLLQSTVAAADRIFEFLDEEEIDLSKKDILEGPVQGNIKFDHVRFGYKGRPKGGYSRSYRRWKDYYSQAVDEVLWPEFR